MASISAWTDADIAAGKRGRASKTVGGSVREWVAPYAKLGAADGNGSILAFAEVSASDVPLELKLLSDALTGFSSVSFGLYRIGTDGQTFLDTAKSDGTSAKAIFQALADLSAGYAVGSEHDCLSALAIADRAKKIWELLGFSNPGLADSRYALCATAATAGTAAGNLALRGRFLQG